MSEWIYHDLQAFKLYTHLLFKAAFQERQEFFGTEFITIKLGQLITGRKQLSAETGLSEQTIRTLLDKFEKSGKINQHSTKVGSLISINYGCFENKSTKIQPTSNQDSTNNQPSINQDLTTIKEIKKERKEEVKNNLPAVGKIFFDEVEVYNHELIDWINTNCPRVKSMSKPLTNESASKLCDEFDFELIKSVLLDMENYKPLHKTSVDTNLTCRNWLKRRNDAKPSNSIKSPTGTQSKTRGDAIQDWCDSQRSNPWLFGDQNP